ncbi:hypothetical protein [Kutzneria chonburiensis]|uniref:Uncharacterized protein n=1 Tax=Kutzneria chonburiensis TaxID=1483604 RepID=A0ABV6MIU8_9PSEU|nr:hypothetical protein [Kutzneria chonburiensis]
MHAHDDRVPGEVLFRTDRRVRIWRQFVSHRQLLLSAVETGEPTRLDLLFKNVDQQCIRSTYDGLVVRFPREDEEFPPDAFVLESGNIRDYVCANSFAWQEDEQSDLGPEATAAKMLPMPFEPTYHVPSAFPEWRPTGPAIPLGDLVDALTDDPEPVQGFRHVHAVVVRTKTGGGREITSPVAVYLTRGEAEEAIRADIAAKEAIAARAAGPDARAAGPDARVQDTLVAKSLADTNIDRWIVPVPVRL